MEYICNFCGKTFVGPSKSRIYKFCPGGKCYADSMRGKPGLRIKDKIIRSGYYYVKDWSHPNSGKQKYIAEHRLIMERHIGRLLSKGEVVHHLDGNKLNNTIENLKLFSSPGKHISSAHNDLYERQKIDFKGKRFSINTEFVKGTTPWNRGLKKVTKVN